MDAAGAVVAAAGARCRTPTGTMGAVVRDTPPPKREPVYESEFAKRHEERFKGVEFDWMDFSATPRRFRSRIAPTRR